MSRPFLPARALRSHLLPLALAAGLAGSAAAPAPDLAAVAAGVRALLRPAVEAARVAGDFLAVREGFPPRDFATQRAPFLVSLAREVAP